MSELESVISKIVDQRIAVALAAMTHFKTPADYRIEAGASIAEAARDSGVDPSTIRRFESGKYRNAREQDATAAKLARIYGCNAQDFLAAVRRQHQSNRR